MYLKTWMLGPKLLQCRCSCGYQGTERERNSCSSAVIKNCFTLCLKQDGQDSPKIADYNEEETLQSIVRMCHRLLCRTLIKIAVTGTVQLLDI